MKAHMSMTMETYFSSLFIGGIAGGGGGTLLLCILAAVVYIVRKRQSMYSMNPPPPSAQELELRLIPLAMPQPPIIPQLPTVPQPPMYVENRNYIGPAPPSIEMFPLTEQREMEREDKYARGFEWPYQQAPNYYSCIDENVEEHFQI